MTLPNGWFNNACSWTWSSFVRVLKYLGATLKNEKMPVWGTLVLLAVGVYGTYVLTPVLNSKFEAAKIKSQYVSDNLKTLNGDTSELVVAIRTLMPKLAERGDPRETARSRLEVGNRITKLMWKAIELGIVAESEPERDLILRYHKSLEALQESIVSARDSTDIATISKELENVVRNTSIVIQFLAKKADLRVAFQPF